MKNKRIWLVSHYSMPPEYEMRIKTERYAHYLGQKGYDVTIFSASTIHNTDINLITDKSLYIERKYGDLKFVHIRCSDYSVNGIRRIINMQQFAYRFRRIAKNLPQPDVVVADVNCTNYKQIYLYCKKRKIPFYVDVRDLWPASIVAYCNFHENDLVIKYLYHKEKTMYKQATGIIFSMEGGYEYIKDHHWEHLIPKSKVYYINNGVDLEQFRYNKENYQINDNDLKSPDTFKVIYTGSIRKVNNLGLILDSAKLVKNKKIKFLVWGDGDELLMLKRRVRDENITNVVFKGKVEKKFIPYIVSHADLNFAHNEATPLFKYGISFNKLFDYMAAGKPIFCDFPCDYNPAVKEGCGIESVDTSASAIASKIDYISELKEKDYEAYCYNALNAARKYDFKNLTNDLISVVVSK